MLCFISSQLLGQYRNFDGAVLCDGMNDYDYYLRKGTIAIDIDCQKCFTNKICQQKYVIYMLFEIFLNVPCTVSFFSITQSLHRDGWHIHVYVQKEIGVPTSSLYEMVQTSYVLLNQCIDLSFLRMCLLPVFVINLFGTTEVLMTTNLNAYISVA